MTTSEREHTSPKVLILGGHGKIALLLAPLLHARGVAVTSVIRNPAHIDEVAETGATPCVADIATATPAELRDLIAGHDAVVFSAGAGGGSPERTYAVDRDAAIATMDAAVAAKVPRYVMVSYLGASVDHGVPADNSFFAYAEAKAAADAHLRASALAWTILGPGALTLEAGTGRIATTVDPEHPQTARANVALVLDAVLDRPDTVGRTIEFTDGAVTIAEALAP